MIVVLVLASAAIGLAAMALGGYALWDLASRFPAESASRLVAQGFVLVVIVALLGAFARGIAMVLRPLVARTPGSADKLNGLLLLLAPAVTGLLMCVYLAVAWGALRLTLAVVGT